MELQIKEQVTDLQFDEITKYCRTLFEKKTRDYGTSWRILRLPSLTDQILIKAQRIRSVQEKGENRVGDSIEGELIGILNYSVMALIQIDLEKDTRIDLPLEEALSGYDKVISETKELLFAKNHDYGEAWRDMRISSMVDIILMKLLRVKQIEDNCGKTLVSEGVGANYRDMINYSLFCLILMAKSGEY